MGVRSLNSFISKIVDGKFKVDMSEVINSFKSGNEYDTLTVIIDLRTTMLFQHVCNNDHEVLLGGRFEEYNERARFIFSQLKSLGVKLVFFIGAAEKESKVESHNFSYENGVQILSAIDRGLDISGDMSGFDIAPLPHLYTNIKRIAREYGEVKMRRAKGNKEVADLASERKACVLMSDDTDFLILEGAWRLWSLKELDFRNLTTEEYNKKALWETLSLSSRQMALFASLAGNKIVEYEMVKTFHQQLPRGNRSITKRFRDIADYVRRIRSDPLNLNRFDKRVLTSVFLPSMQQSGMEALQKSLEYYLLVKEQNNHSDDELLRLLAEDSKFFHYTIFSKGAYFVTFNYSDLKTKEFSSSLDMTRALFCRILGVLLQNEVEKGARIFYFKLEHDTPLEIVRLEPEYPTRAVPAIMDLLYKPYGENAELDEVRWDLLCFIISSKLRKDILKKIPKENLLNILTLFYLLERNEVNLDEADCILISCNVPQKIKNSFDFNEVRTLNGRDARLAFLYPNVYRVIERCFTSVGLQEYCTLFRFDGLCFHSLRKTWEEQHEFQRILLDSFGPIRIYSREFGLL